ncbi:hypothetical protein [Thalassoglobus sp.]|uniref:hypothetical protein n=1 Tax=Thalassoglobus sp. TaxID=2795869 RepID=UPI003AA9792E
MITSQQHRVLFVAYQFPPVGGVGVHRVTKFVKYLPQHGWNSTILTVSNPSVPLHDQSLLKDIPAGSLIRRAKTYEPGYGLKKKVSGGQGTGKKNLLVSAIKSGIRAVGNTLLQPDSQVLWHPHAYRDGLKILKDVHHDAIVATGPPFSSLLLGAKLAKRTGLPLILDYRDEWDISNAYWENKSQSRLSNWIQTRQQHKALKAARSILATTPSSAAAVGEIANQAGSDAVASHIYNGFDPDDFPMDVSLEKEDFGNGTSRFRLAFIGTLWNLNSIEPVVNALEMLNQTSPAIANEIELLLAGRRTEEQEAIVDRLKETAVAVSRLPFIDHTQAVQLMRTADSLLMINSDLPKTQRIINAKTFEYMAAKRPMFVVAPEGDVWDVVRDLPGTVLCEPKMISNIADQLSLLVEQHRCGVEYSSGDWNINHFHRRQLAGELASLLNQTIRQESQSVSRFRSLFMGRDVQLDPEGS